ncbi:rna-directed dna polymerase from mobile element jockey-like [Limosa lapponica baueri]|uniref:Rna-directed dna polymerase from mobile element jockey-like n=1 Tax=Limosa lapponica baueri TaxID=1758121 RepID=A0A2I0TSG3_LIMLA|nr:rna-directed dna polymerase from mobile element jockey-like [Limosa lapponica baueri]
MSRLRQNALLDLQFTNEEELMDDVKNNGRLGHNECVIVTFNIPRGMRRINNKITTLDFKRANPLAYLGICLETPTGTLEAWSIFEDNLLKAQVRSVLACSKLSKCSRRLAQMTRKLLSETES